AIDKELGSVAWEYALPGSNPGATALACDGQRVFVCNGSLLFELDHETGEELGRQALGPPGRQTNPAARREPVLLVEAGRLFVCAAGTLKCLRISDQSVLWEHSHGRATPTVLL